MAPSSPVPTTASTSGNLGADVIAVAFDQASGNDELLCTAGGFEASHFQDSVDRFLLGGVNEGAGIDDEDVGLPGIGGEAGAGLLQQAHHDFAIHQIFGAAEADKADGGVLGVASYESRRRIGPLSGPAIGGGLENLRGVNGRG